MPVALSCVQCWRRSVGLPAAWAADCRAGRNRASGWTLLLFPLTPFCVLTRTSTILPSTRTVVSTRSDSDRCRDDGQIGAVGRGHIDLAVKDILRGNHGARMADHRQRLFHRVAGQVDDGHRADRSGWLYRRGCRRKNRHAGRIVAHRNRDRWFRRSGCRCRTRPG